ncbi:hypothetical protein CC1G_15438 [Coprinopsis cinerea okayama7|uniref:Uncharacterized protein n=1 Tax=Coprinopsis cinerea (strain Okayama-7 / 130 / ATCC MYA-4618 / FGSC 9003) TaxID=240176 RepID=D6RQP1_COPC7|nr:hypothetical protein CC1G_15438 [Coprinopsis cinerea okayama7\|eukprot:XP_002910161.1 hypothetical protein CC1G_15438 [Coprinopsis cinerea okayama7\
MGELTSPSLLLQAAFSHRRDSVSLVALSNSLLLFSSLNLAASSAPRSDASCVCADTVTVFPEFAKLGVWYNDDGDGGGWAELDELGVPGLPFPSRGVGARRGPPVEPEALVACLAGSDAKPEGTLACLVVLPFELDAAEEDEALDCGLESDEAEFAPLVE